MHNLLRPLVALLFVALLAAACSSSDGSDSSDAATDAVDTSATETETGPADDTEEADEPAEEEPEPAERTEAEPEPADEPEAEPEDATEEVSPDALALDGEMIDWEPCGDLTQCGTVEVPIDYRDPSLGTLNIAVNVHRSTDPDERIGYLFVNPGGPGASAVEIVTFIRQIGIPPELLDAFDIVGMDPRGVGGSEPEFACGSGIEQFEVVNQIDELPDTAEEVAIGNEASLLCEASMGPAAGNIGTDVVVQDMDEVRKALGADQISYLGFSYGSTLGGWYATKFPDNVRAMVVDGAANPLARAETVEEAIDLARITTGPIEDQFAAALASCDSDACPIFNDGDPEAVWYDAAEKLDIVADAAEGSSFAAQLGITGSLYSQTQWPDLHQAIFDLNENDDPSGFLAAVDVATIGQGVNAANITLHVNCLDQWALFNETAEEQVALALELEDEVEAALEGEYPLTEAIDLPETATVCPHLGEALDAPVLDGPYDGGGVPIVVIGNTSDPITPFVQSEQFANDVLSNGYLVRVEHPQHVVYPANGCVNDIVHATLIDLELPEGEPTCEAEGPAQLAEVSLERVELPNGATAVVPAGWLEIAPGVYAQSPAENDPVILVYLPTGGDPEGTLEALASQAGVSPELAFEDVEIGDNVWDLYDGIIGPDVTGLPEDVSVRIGYLKNGDNVLIIGQAFTRDIEALTETVLNPILESYVPGDS
jgi:pimeloyl-ACP methyl ester carboxylesterase